MSLRFSDQSFRSHAQVLDLVGTAIAARMGEATETIWIAVRRVPVAVVGLSALALGIAVTSSALTILSPSARALAVGPVVPQAAMPAAAPALMEAPAPAPAVERWIDIAKPFRLFDLPSPTFGREPDLYTARRHRTGGGRADTLAYGSFEGDAPWLRVTVYRVGAEGPPKGNVFVSIARAAAGAGLAVIHSGLAEPVPTRFGPLDVAEVRLAGRGASRACVGYRLGIADPSLLITGLACAPGDKPPSAASLACTVDRLDLLSAGDDTALADYFAKAEFQRAPGCERVRWRSAWHRPRRLRSRGAPRASRL